MFRRERLVYIKKKNANFFTNKSRLLDCTVSTNDDDAIYFLVQSNRLKEPQ